jgi:hypothetical protein
MRAIGWRRAKLVTRAVDEQALKSIIHFFLVRNLYHQVDDRGSSLNFLSEEF